MGEERLRYWRVADTRDVGVEVGRDCGMVTLRMLQQDGVSTRGYRHVRVERLIRLQVPPQHREGASDVGV